jgi:asparagine synthase (glutamine-hydrolysing)
MVVSLLRNAFHTSVPRKCGVLSYFYSSPSTGRRVEDDRQSLWKGLQTLKHRGPDGTPSLWTDAENTVGLGHTRLTIIDLSEQNKQPMHSRDNQLHLAMNGELYDHDRIRRQAIENNEYQFISQSDSEIALYLYRKYGLEFPRHLRGEFAITMYDEQRKVSYDA